MRISWKKWTIVAIDLLLAAYIIAAITTLNHPQAAGAATVELERNLVCSKVSIDIRDAYGDGFLDESEVRHMLERQGLWPMAQRLRAIDVRAIEEGLESNPVIDDAECYKTRSGHVLISLSQRRPVIRVKAIDGDDYYVDSHGGILRGTMQTTDLIVATGHITQAYASRELSRIGQLLMDDPLWCQQIVQLNVREDGSIEAIPRVGGHKVVLGSPRGMEEKLSRLRKFYKYGLSQVGWDRYSEISVAFGNQIICKKRKETKQTENRDI